ncbi:MAG: hypothetical protein DRJ56_01075 [Thermoprotei archaeon]|nr:MAG: hypothetical protein DRJ56_01075 [Thermoprotei archaeon]
MTIRLARFLEEGVDALFYCWTRRVIGGGHDEEFHPDKASRYWQFDEYERRYTEFSVARYVKPKGFATVSLRSREVFPYGFFELNARLPAWEGGPTLWFGFEIEDLFGGGVIHFRFVPGRPGTLSACAGAFPKPLCVELPGFPSDYAESRHVYSIRVHRSMAVWSIDGVPRCFVIYPDNVEGGRVVASGPPYAVAIAPVRPSTCLAVLLDIDGCPEDEYVWEDLHPWGLRVLPGDPEAKLATPLYVAGSGEKLADATVSGEVVSHPVPAYDLRRKTVYFKADAPGTLRLEAYTLSSGWEEYDSWEVPKSRLLRLSVADEVLVLRVAYAPRGSGRVRVAEFLGA